MTPLRSALGNPTDPLTARAAFQRDPGGAPAPVDPPPFGPLLRRPCDARSVAASAVAGRALCKLVLDGVLATLVFCQVYLGDMLVWIYGLHTVPVVDAIRSGAVS